MANIPLKNISDTGVTVSALGLGTVKFGRNEAVKYPHSFQVPDDSSVVSLLSGAHEAGINLLDTAPAYGTAQARIGRLIGADNDWIICSKVGERFINGRSMYDYSESATTADIENSLRELKRDVLDIALIHSDGNDEDILQNTPIVETLSRMKEQGKIKALGISSKTIAGGILALQFLDIIMCTYNLVETNELPVIEAAGAAGKAVFIKKGLMSGHLQKARVTNPLHASYRHIFLQQAVSSLIIGTINPMHLRQNIDAFLSVIREPRKAVMSNSEAELTQHNNHSV